MRVYEAIGKLKEYQSINLKPGSIKSYEQILDQFCVKYGEYDITEITSENISSFINEIAGNSSQATKHLRFTQIKAFFNFCINILEIRFINPCSTQLLNRTFKNTKNKKRVTINKDVIDEMIYQIKKFRDRLLLELQSRCGLRIGEVLKIKCRDIESRKITLESPKSGSETELAFMPASIAEKVQSYIAEHNLTPEDRLFNLSYAGARDIVVRAGEKIGIQIRPHDLRRHSATYASRNGVPLEVVSKVILRHQDLRTTQIYLGKISDYEALHWVDRLYDK